MTVDSALSAQTARGGFSQVKIIKLDFLYTICLGEFRKSEGSSNVDDSNAETPPRFLCQMSRRPRWHLYVRITSPEQDDVADL